jgi:adenylate cyclase
LTLFVYVFCSTSFIQETELKLLDYRFRLDPIPERADTSIVLVVIDDFSLDFFSENGISWPWPRSFYGYAVDYFTSAGARSVIFDMQFYESDIDREETYADETDSMFASSIANNSNIYLASQLLLDSTFVHPYASNSTIQIENKFQPEITFSGIRAPIDPFITSARSIGIINAVPDNDGVIRKSSLLFKLNEMILPQMAFKVWLDQIGNDKKIQASNQELHIGNYLLPLDGNGRYLLNWYGRDAFTTYSFRAVISSASAVLNGQPPVLSPDIFKDKHIIIGATAAGLYDLKTNPYSKVMPGMEIWATALGNFVNKDFINILPRWINFIFTLLVIFGIFYLIINLNPKKANILVLLILVLLVGINLILWKTNRILLNLVIPVIGFVISYLLINMISYLLEGRSKREIRRIFTRYLNKEVIQQLEEDPQQVKLGGEEIEATVLYTDIYDFTSLSEKKTPTELVKSLNDYFEKLIEFVFKFNGLLDKYTGDGIMVLFGAPIPRDDHALLSCRTAYAHKKFREDLMRKEKLTPDEKLHLKTRIGMNSGLLVAGNIGSEKRMDYTAIGDTVNLASRLEGVNKIYQTNIVLSESTYNQVKSEFLCRELDSLRVKGKKEPTKIFELIDVFSELETKEKPDWIQQYEEALNIYRKGDWQEAGNIFMELAREPFNDKVSQVLLTRCKYLLEFPPRKWDGILTLEVK